MVNLFWCNQTVTHFLFFTILVLWLFHHCSSCTHYIYVDLTQWICSFFKNDWLFHDVKLLYLNDSLGTDSKRLFLSHTFQLLERSVIFWNDTFWCNIFLTVFYRDHEKQSCSLYLLQIMLVYLFEYKRFFKNICSDFLNTLQVTFYWFFYNWVHLVNGRLQ